MFVSFVLAKEVNLDNCINYTIKNKSVYCTNCGVYVGYFDDADEDETITFFNVREIMSMHTSYSRRSTEQGVQNMYPLLKEKKSALRTYVISNRKLVNFLHVIIIVLFLFDMSYFI